LFADSEHVCDEKESATRTLLVLLESGSWEFSYLSFASKLKKFGNKNQKSAEFIPKKII
jgi:hypothetical protein